MQVARKAARFPGKQAVLATETARSVLSMTRCRSAIRAGEPYVASMRAEDAFVVLFQLRAHPGAELMVGGKVAQTRPAARSTLKIVNLGEGDVGCRHFAPLDTLMLHLPRTALDEITDTAGISKIDVLRVEPWCIRDPVFDQIHPLLLEALSTRAAADRLLYDHWLIGLATHVAHRYGGVAPKTRQVRGGLAPWQESRVKELLSATMADAMSLRQVASECQLSPDHLARAFKISTGVTPHQWLQGQRVDRAKSMLATTGLPVADIARACGFSDQSHLCRVFARRTGSSPGVWRRQAAADSE